MSIRHLQRHKSIMLPGSHARMNPHIYLLHENLALLEVFARFQYCRRHLIVRTTRLQPLVMLCTIIVPISLRKQISRLTVHLATI